MRWALYLWPGLPQLWARASWSALGVAVSAGAVLDVALLGTFVWTELLSQGLRNALWAALGIAWAAAAVFAVVWDRRHATRESPELEKDKFSEATEHYLQGNWFEAERALGNLLRQDDRDLEARLMLATLYRHRGRLDEAAGQLELLGRFAGAEKWELEIRREQQLLTSSSANNR
jgi:hypothetical protein